MKSKFNKYIRLLVVFTVMFIINPIYSQSRESEQVETYSITSPSLDNIYTYKAYVTGVYDGDTITATIDLGFKISISRKIRLLYINAPEMRGDNKIAGKKSRNYLRSILLNRDIIIKTKKDKSGKYGRLLAEIWVLDKTGRGERYLLVNFLLVQKGYAKFKKY